MTPQTPTVDSPHTEGPTIWVVVRTDLPLFQQVQAAAQAAALAAASTPAGGCPQSPVAVKVLGTGDADVMEGVVDSDVWDKLQLQVAKVPLTQVGWELSAIAVSAMKGEVEEGVFAACRPWSAAGLAPGASQADASADPSFEELADRVLAAEALKELAGQEWDAAGAAIQTRVDAAVELAEKTFREFRLPNPIQGSLVARGGELSEIRREGVTFVIETCFRHQNDTRYHTAAIPAEYLGAGAAAAMRRDAVAARALQDEATAAKKTLSVEARRKQDLAQLRQLQAKYPEEARR